MYKLTQLNIIHNKIIIFNKKDKYYVHNTLPTPHLSH